MPHRTPGLLNTGVESFGGPSYVKFRVSFQQTFNIVFDPRMMEPSSGTKGTSVKLLHHQYLELMAIYDIVYF